MDRRSIARLRTATDLVTSRLAVDLSLPRTADTGHRTRQPAPTDLTEDLKARRQAFGWSIEDVGERCGIDGQTLHDWERGADEPRLDMARRWAAALGLSVKLVPADGAPRRGMTVDWDRRRIAVDGNPVRLTPMEWKALERLARVPGELVTHLALFHHLYGEDQEYRAQSTAIRVLITKLRRLLPLRIEAKWGKGYIVGGLERPQHTPRDCADGGGDSAAAPAAVSRLRDAAECGDAAVPGGRATMSAGQGLVALAERKPPPPIPAHIAAKGPCRAEELGVIERFLAERGATRCPDVKAIQQSPLPTLVWDKIKRKWVRPAAE